MMKASAYVYLSKLLIMWVNFFFYFHHISSSINSVSKLQKFGSLGVWGSASWLGFYYLSYHCCITGVLWNIKSVWLILKYWIIVIHIYQGNVNLTIYISLVRMIMWYSIYLKINYNRVTLNNKMPSKDLILSVYICNEVNVLLNCFMDILAKFQPVWVYIVFIICNYMYCMLYILYMKLQCEVTKYHVFFF